MAFSGTHALAASLLASVAFVPAAMAQQAQPDAQCAELQVVVDEQEGVIQQQWLDQAEEVAAEGDAAVCDAWLVEARSTIEQGDAAEMIEGRIVVRQPDPEVTVQQPAPEIAVTQPQPQVDVQQGQPEIIVRQVAPTVRIQMPEPTVTIDQPQPEIIVRMPDPEVRVTQAEPQVQVSQAQPQVNVEQGEAQVDVQLQEQQPTDQAAVEVQQGQPIVRLNEQAGQEQAQVNIQEGQPTVSYEAAEPIVEIEGGGEPNVQFTESGEPNVQFVEGNEEPGMARQEMGQQETAQQGVAPQQQADAQMEADDAWRQGRTAMTPPQTEREGYQPVQVAGIAAEDLEGATVYGADNEEITTVSDLALNSDGEVQHFLMDVGGFLGLGSRTVAVGFDEATIMHSESTDDYAIHISATREQLEALPDVEETAAQ